MELSSSRGSSALNPTAMHSSGLSVGRTIHLPSYLGHRHAYSVSLTCNSGSSSSGRRAKIFRGVQQKRSSTVLASASTSDGVISTSPQAAALVDSLLSLVEGSDRGVALGEAEAKKVDELIQKLEGHCIPEPLQSPLLFGGWDVVYSSNPTSSGGYYRSAIGRALLKTKQMIQDVKPPAAVKNAVSFSALGNLVDGEVSLEGKLEPLDAKLVKIMFEPPNLKLGSFEFQYGGTSSVEIAIIYLDERIRLGRGSRGSLFVFKRR